MTSAHHRLAAALEQLMTQLEATRRRRTTDPAPIELTNAYASFVFAAGFARLGQRERARALAAGAEVEAGLRGCAVATLEATQTFDTVRACLVPMFSARVAQALARRRRHAPLPGALAEQINALERYQRYKVDLLREALWTLELEPIEAFRDFALRRQRPLVAPLELVEHLALDEPAARAARIAQQIERAAGRTSEDRATLLSACFDAMLDLVEGDGIPLLVQAMPLVPGLPAALHAQVLAVAARYGWGELIPELVAALRMRLADESPDVLGRVLSPCLRALRGLGLYDELAALIAVGEARVGDVDIRRALHVRDATTPPAQRDVHLVLAGSLTLLDDPRGPALLDAAHASLEQEMDRRQWLQLLRDLAWGVGHGSLDPALERIARLVPHFRMVTSGYPVNDFYCLADLHFVDSLVHGITCLADDDPRAAPVPSGAPVA